MIAFMLAAQGHAHLVLISFTTFCIRLRSTPKHQWLLLLLLQSLCCTPAPAQLAADAGAASPACPAAAAAATAGQKKMIPSFDDIKNQGTFVIELLGIDPAVKKAQMTCAKGEDLRAPIPSSVTRQFGTMGQVLKNVSVG